MIWGWATHIFANIYEIKSIEDLELFLQEGAEEILRLLLKIKSKKKPILTKK